MGTRKRNSAPEVEEEEEGASVPFKKDFMQSMNNNADTN